MEGDILGFDGFPALPTESTIYKILLSREGESIQLKRQAGLRNQGGVLC